MCTSGIAKFAKVVFVAGCVGFCLPVTTARADGLDGNEDIWRSMRLGAPQLALTSAKASVLHESDTATLDFHFDKGRAALDLMSSHGKFFLGVSLNYDGMVGDRGRSRSEFASGTAGLNPGASMSLGEDVHALGSAVFRFGVRLTPRTALFSAIGGALQQATRHSTYAESGFDLGRPETIRKKVGIDPKTCRPIYESVEVPGLRTDYETSGSYSQHGFETGLYVGAGLWTALSPFALLKFDYTLLDFGETTAEMKLSHRSEREDGVIKTSSSSRTVSWRDIRQSFKMRLKVAF